MEILVIFTAVANIIFGFILIYLIGKVSDLQKTVSELQEKLL